MLLNDKTTGDPLIFTPAERADRSGVIRATMIDTLGHDRLAIRDPDLTDRCMMSVKLTLKVKP